MRTILQYLIVVTIFYNRIEKALNCNYERSGKREISINPYER